jgi:hypothetical protein
MNDGTGMPIQPPPWDALKDEQMRVEKKQKL